jgi:cytochrome P450
MLAAASGDGATRDDEIVDNVVFLFFAGIETTSRLVSAGLVALLGHRKQLAALRNDPSLVPSATEEMLRFDPPLQTHPRLVIERVEIGTRTVRPGRVLLLMLGSANRDERVFERPDEFDVTRTPNPHLSFGMGPHFCVGAHLARLENNVLLETLLARFQTLELAGPPTLRFDGGFRSFASVPIAGEVS